jgi:hypothetical protein
MGQRIFISSDLVDHPPASLLIDGLRRAGALVEHSPRNPHDGPDSRWPGWYSQGLPDSLSRCQSFVAVINRAWASSSWMACEAHEARKRLSFAFYWNPERVTVTAARMKPYLTTQLPASLEEAISILARQLHNGYGQ